MLRLEFSLILKDDMEAKLCCFQGRMPGSSSHPETDGPAGNDEGRGRAGPCGNRLPRVRPRPRGKGPRAEQPGRPSPPERAAPMPGGYGVMGDDDSIDYSVHEAWNEATNVYLVVILVSFGLFVYAKRNKRKIMRIFSVPPTAETLSEPNFYDTISKIRLRQQLEMYSISRKYEYQQPQNQADSVQLSLEWNLRKWATWIIVKQYGSKFLILLNHEQHCFKLLSP